MLWWTLQQLKSKDAGKRLAAIGTLADDVTPRVAMALVPVLSDPEESVRRAAAKALGSTRNDEFLPLLLPTLMSPDEHAREGGAAALGRLRCPEAIPRLVPLLRDLSYAVRWQAARALESLGWSPPDNVSAALFAVARGKIEEASAYGVDAVEPLALVLQSGAYHQRRLAVAGLSHIADARVVRALIGALKDNDDQVRSATAEALCRIADPGSADALVKALKDVHRHVRAVAAQGLGEFGGPNVVEPLMKVMRDRCWEVREAACIALGRLGDPRACELLVAALNDTDREVREAAIRGLNHLNDQRAIGPLVLALVDEQDSVRQLAGAALGGLDMRWEISEGARAVLPQLQEAMRHSEYWVRQAAADTLARIGRMKYVEHTVAAPADGGARQHAASLVEPAHLRKQTAVEFFVKLLGDFDRELRIAAAETLGRLGQASALAALTCSLEDGDRAVRRAAALSVEMLRGRTTPETNVILRGEDFPL